MKQWPKGAVAVICGRHDDPYRQEVEGSLETECWQCGYKILIARETVSKALWVNHKIICVECAAEYVSISGRKLVNVERPGVV